MKRRWSVVTLKMGTRLSTYGIPKKFSFRKTVSQDNVFAPIKAPNSKYNHHLAPLNHTGFVRRSSEGPLLTSTPAVTISKPPLATCDSQSTLDESGISSKGSSMDDSVSPNMAYPSSAPSTPDLLSRRTAPPKPPRLRSSYFVEGTEPDQPYLMQGTSTMPVQSPNLHQTVRLTKSSLADVTNTLDASVAASPDGSLVMKQSPIQMKDKIYQTLVKTREFLLYEVHAEPLIPYLTEKGVVNGRTAQQLRRCYSRQTQSELLLDIITSKGQEEFRVFCEALRIIGHQEYIADLLTVLDLLIETVTTSERLRSSYKSGTGFGSDFQMTGATVPTWNPNMDHYNNSESLPENSTIVFNTNSIMQCMVCTGNNNFNSECPPNDCASFDLDIFYHDTESGNVKTIKDVRTIKLKRKMRVPQHNDSFLERLEKEHADRFIPVLSLNLYNHCFFENGINTLATILEQYSCVWELSLVKSHIDSRGMKRLGQALKSNKGLAKLDIRLNVIDDTAASYIAEGLRCNMYLKVLNIMSTELSSQGTKVLLDGLAKNVSVTELDIGFNDLQDAGCKSIATLLTGNSNLRKLRMRDNNITDRGFQVLFKSLKKNSRLAMLDISSNRLGVSSLSTLAEVLLCNRTLKELNLENCLITKEGCVALARALKTNTVLRVLDLSMNPLGNQGVEALSDGLKYNHVIDVLCLNMCNIGNRGFIEILDALKVNTTMRVMKLCYNVIGRLDNDVSMYRGNHHPLDEVYERLCHMLQFNKNLKVLLWGNQMNDPFPELQATGSMIT